MKEQRALNLFGQMRRTARREPGIVPSQEIEELIKNGKIRSRAEISKDQIQPASIDLRLGNIACRVRASFIPSKKFLISAKIRELQLEEIDLSQPTLLKVGSVYIVPLIETLELPPDMRGKANPKSTTGRLDIFTRLMAEGSGRFEEVPLGYSGDLYVEIVPQTFPIIIKEGTKLNQIRFFRGAPQRDDEQLRLLSRRGKLIYKENGDAPTEISIDKGLRISVDLQGSGQDDIVAYRAKRGCSPINLANVGAYEVEEFWEPIRAPNSKSIVLNPDDFYLLASKQRVGVPPDYAAEMEQYDSSIGEFTVHYAGFFDPGFGYGIQGEIKGTKAVLEVRAHEVPILLEDGQDVGRMTYLKMAAPPNELYGQNIGSSYQWQGLALSNLRNSELQLVPLHLSQHGFKPLPTEPSIDFDGSFQYP